MVISASVRFTAKRIGRLIPLFSIALMAVVISGGAAQGVDAEATAATAKLRAAGVDIHVIKSGGTAAVININNDLNVDAWKALESFHDLKDVHVDGRGIGNEQLARVCNIKTIEVFAIGAWTSVTEAGLPAVAQLPNLRSVEFRALRFPLTATLKGLANCKNLSSLSFPREGQGLTEEGMKAIGNFAELKELTLDAGWVPSYTANDFVHLAALKNLQTLTLQTMVLPYEDGLAHLKGSNLKKLKIIECYVTDSDFAKLKEALPGVTIERVDSKDLAIEQWNASLERYKTQGLPKFFGKSSK